MNPHTASREFSPDADKVATVREFIERFLDDIGFEMEDFDIQLAIEEWYVNIQKHGWGSSEIRIDLSYEDDWLEITITDDAPSFNPEYAEMRDHPKDVESAEPGGLGIYLIMKLMDETTYERKDRRNVFRMRKHLGGD